VKSFENTCDAMSATEVMINEEALYQVFDHYAKFGCSVSYRVMACRKSQNWGHLRPPYWNGDVADRLKHAPFPRVLPCAI